MTPEASATTEVLLTFERARTVRSALCVAFNVSGRYLRTGGAVSVSRVVVIGGTMLGRNMDAIEKEFCARQGARNCQREPVYHASFMPCPGIGVTDETWCLLIGRFAAEVGFKDTAHTIVRRETVGGYRIHLIAARVDTWGSRVSAPDSAQAEEALAVAVRGEESP